MSRHSEIMRSALEGIIAMQMNKNAKFSFIGIIQSLDNNKTSCTVMPLDPQSSPMSNISLTPTGGVANKVPTIGSRVMVTMTDSNSGFISQMDAVTSQVLAPGTVNYGGLVMIDPLVTLLNEIITYIETHITLFDSHTHLTTAFGTPSSPPAPLDTSTPPIVNSANLQNTVVTHSNGVQPNGAYQAALTAAEDNVTEMRAYLNVAQQDYNDDEKNGDDRAIQEGHVVLLKAKANYDAAVAVLKQLQLNPY